MKKTFYSCIFLFLLCNSYTQESSLLERISGVKDETSLDICLDDDINILVCGYFSSDTMFSGGKFVVNNTLYSEDAFLIKYDITGQPIWLDNPGGPVYQRAQAVASDPDGNIFLAGQFIGSFDFGTSVLNSLNETDGMLLKYSSDGDELWGVSIGSTGYVDCKKMIIDGEGNVYVGGQFKEGFLIIEDTTLYNSGATDIFLAKFSGNGNLINVQCFGGYDNDFIWGLCSDNNDDVYMSGGYHSYEITFGSYTFPNYNSIRAAYVCQFYPDGQVKWADSYSLGFDQQFYGIGVDDDKNMYISGYFKDTFNWGDTTFISQGHFDVFLLKYDQNHEKIWARHIHGPDYDRSDDLVVSNDGQVYLTTVSFGTICFQNRWFNNYGERDFVIAQYDQNGKLTKAIQGKGSGDEEAPSIDLDPSGFVYFSGYFDSPLLEFSNKSLNNSHLGYKDAYIGKIGFILGVENYDVDKILIAYPNPFRDKIYFEDQVYSAELFSLQGELVGSCSNCRQIHIDEQLPNAVYLLRLTTSPGDKARTYKMVKQ